MNRRTTRRHSAFTLIELMVATAIATMLTIGVFAIYRTTSRTFETVQTDRAVFDTAIAAVEIVGRDLTCAARVPLSGNMYFSLDNGAQADNLNSDISFHTATHVRMQDDTDQFQINRVHYILQNVAKGAESVPTPTLLRITQAMAVDGTLGEMVQDDVLREVEAFRVTLFDGEKWHETWPAADGRLPIPSAARISISCRHNGLVRTFESTVIIRSGLPL